MNCRDCHDLLQACLDGAAAGDPAALATHLKDCPDCAALAAAARRLADGLRRLTPPAPPPGLADRIAGRALQDRRARLHKRRRWASAGTLAVAASLLIAIGLRAWRPAPPVEQPQPTPPQAAHVEPAPPGPDTIHDSVSQARSAVAALTSRTADEAVAQARALLPDLSRPALNDMDLTPPLEAPAAPLREAGQNVSAGLEPVTDFSRRAVGQFLRDLSPMGVDVNTGS
jgi:predicted anti-sigma-YlaC factor YlaD